MPTLTIIRGLPGSGKSTLARKLAEETGAIHIEPDMLCVQDGEYNYTPARYQKAINNVKTVISHLAFNMKCDIVFADVLPQTAQVDSFRYLIPSNYKLVVKDLHISKEESLKRNKHNVKPEDIENMAAAWQSWRRGETVTDCNQPTTNSSQLPKLTAEVFDRPDCPKSALWATVDEDGTAYFHLFAPMLYADEWQHTNCCKKIPGKWDATNWTEIIQRPEKKTLPDWCKIDAICWHKRCDYFKVTMIDNVSSRVDIQQVDDKSRGYLSFHSVCNDVCQARLRPFNDEEMRELVGQAIDTPCGYLLVDAYSKRDSNIHTADGWFTADYLMLADYTINGKPCSVLEHLEDGEWIE